VTTRRPRRTAQPPVRATRETPSAQATRRQRSNAKKQAADTAAVTEMLGIEVDSTGYAADTNAAAARVSGPRTAKNTRQNIPNPTMAEIQATQIRNLPVLSPDQPSVNHEQDEEQDEVSDQDAAPVTDLVGRIVHKFTERHVEHSRNFILRTRIVELTDNLHRGAKIKTGRKAEINTLAVLTAMHLLVRDDKPLLITEIRDVLYLRLNPNMQRLLGVRPDPRPAGGVALNLWKDRTHARVARAFHRFLDTIDPSVLPKNRIRPWDEINDLALDLSVEEVQQRRAALTWVANRFLEIAYLDLPQSVRDRAANNPFGKPGYAIDGTPVPAFARGKGVNNTIASSDPDAGWYMRTGDHRDPDDSDTTGGSRGTVRKALFGREAHLLITGDMAPGDRQYFPYLPLAFTTDRPGQDPAGATRRVIANILDRGHAPGYLAGDLLYPNQQATHFQIPAREAGFDLVMSYGKDQEGIQETHASGMNLIEGTYHAPCMPKHLADAVTDFRAGTIDQREFADRIRARKQFEMRTKSKPKNGLGERLSCPAAGPHPTAICALKPKSQNERATTQPDGRVLDLRPTIDHTKVLTRGQAPTVCRQEAVSVSLTDGAKFRQTIPFGTPEHTNTYNVLRQAQEGIHGSVKDEAGTALASPGRRRVRGMAAMDIFIGLLFAEIASRRIRTFMEKSRIDENGDRYVPRVKRTGDHATTHNPPGAAPPPGPEPGNGQSSTKGAA
jgi:hypothetical protein